MGYRCNTILRIRVRVCVYGTYFCGNTKGFHRNVGGEAQIGPRDVEAVVDNRGGVGIGGWHGSEGANNGAVVGAVLSADHVIDLEKGTTLLRRLILVALIVAAARSPVPSLLLAVAESAAAK